MTVLARGDDPPEPPATGGIPPRPSFAPAPGAAPLRRMIAAQARLETRTLLRNGEQLLLTLVIPLLLLAAFIIGIGIPYHYFGGIRPMFAALVHAKPQHFVMPGSTPNLGHSWFISTVLLTSFGFYMWPHLFQNFFSAKDGGTVWTEPEGDVDAFLHEPFLPAPDAGLRLAGP